MSSLQDLVNATPGFYARPDSIISLLEIIEDPVVEVEKLLPIVNHDPGLSAGLLKLCNSPLYGFKRRIGSPRDALVLLGNLTFARLCFTLSLEPVLHNELPGYDLDLDDLWQHCLITAYGSAFLVKAIGLSELRDRAFTAGLLHDIGKLVLDHPLTENTSLVQGSVSQKNEREITGFDHSEAGAALLESWDVPKEVSQAVRWHHEPLKAGENKRLALALATANKIGNFAIAFNQGSANVEKWVENNFDSSAFPMETISKLAGIVSSKNQNIVSLALGPGL
ncbi:MAG: HDOD domain-containing protein [bacterium]|nr:HDOD domain-containing protein [bacterium]